jgi:hypothetical protein
MADTHVPRRARDLPAELWAAVDAADVVVHAGDWVDVPLLDALEGRAKRLVACYGNNDGPALRARLPEMGHARLGGLRLGVIHETGQAAGREARCAANFPDFDVLVFGHSHIPWDTIAPGGLRLGVIHETGQAAGREARCAANFPDFDVLVFGHSHIPWDTVAPGGLRLLNPGSPTDRRRQPFGTYMTASLEDGQLADVELHELPRRA